MTPSPETKTMTELKACPCHFCGSTATSAAFFRASDDYQGWQVECSSCGGSGPMNMNTEAEAITAWNTRPCESAGTPTPAADKVGADSVDLESTFGPILKDKFPDYDSLTRFHAAYALAEAAISAMQARSAEPVTLPDIGPDPFKGPREEYTLAKAEDRLRTAFTVQQKGAPDQTALVWRCDLLKLFHELPRLRSIEEDWREKRRPVEPAGMMDAAWKAYQNTGIDLCADSDDETRRCVENAVRTALTFAEPAGEEPVALELFKRAAYPVCSSINARGYNWCEAYLDAALTYARAITTSPPPALHAVAYLYQTDSEEWLSRRDDEAPKADCDFKIIPLYARPATPTNPERLVEALRRCEETIRRLNVSNSLDGLPGIVAIADVLKDVGASLSAAPLKEGQGE